MGPYNSQIAEINEFNKMVNENVKNVSRKSVRHDELKWKI